MAIEKMKKLTIIFPARESERLEEWLYARSSLHLASLEREFTRLGAGGGHIHLDEQEAVENLARVNDLRAERDSLFREKKSFIDSMLPVKAVVRKEEIQEALGSIDLKALHAEVKRRTHALREGASRRALIAREHQHLMLFVFLSVPVNALRALKRTFFMIAEGSTARLGNVARDEEAAGLLAWEVRRRHGELLTVVFAGRKKKEARCADILRAHGFRILEYPDISLSAKDRIEEIGREEEDIRTEADNLLRQLRLLLSPEVSRGLDCLIGYWESERKRAENARLMLCSTRAGVARGYAKAADARGFIVRLEKEFPGASVITADPKPGDAVPVSIRLSRWTRPGQLLINMFGLPDYFSIDPTSYLLLVFLCFFGICFADVVYGLLLMFFSSRLIRRYRRQENLREFFRLFYYCGISTVIFGVLTGSWAADIYSADYFGPNNLLLRFVQRTTVLDMLAKPVIALVVALAIGILNQFYGIVMRMIKEVRQTNWKGVVYDGVFWLVYLGGLLVFILGSFAGCVGWLRTASLAAVATGATGLILTQGRDEKSIIGKAVFGLVSLYGIVGGYGTVSFIGDVLSYSRLLALGLTTYIVGMSFNIIAKVVPQIITSLFPFTAALMSGPAGGLLVISVMVFGHLFNFFLSILSAFVHSARLILLEWFGRFYQGGGTWFSPHGFASDSVELINQ